MLTRLNNKPFYLTLLMAMLAMVSGVAMAEEVVVEAAEAAPSLDSGNTAWMLTATALVLFMTIPGLSRSGTFLWWPGAQQKRVVGDDAVFRHYCLDDDFVDGVWL